MKERFGGGAQPGRNDGGRSGLLVLAARTDLAEGDRWPMRRTMQKAPGREGYLARGSLLT